MQINVVDRNLSQIELRELIRQPIWFDLRLLTSLSDDECLMMIVIKNQTAKQSNCQLIELISR